MAFQDVRDYLVYGLADGFVNEEEFLIIYNMYESVNPLYPYWEVQPFCLETMDASECLAEFRVKKDDIPALAIALRIPNQFVCHQGTICNGLEGLCLLLRRLIYPCRYVDLIKRFARPVPELCMIFNTVLDWMYDAHGFRLTSWNQFFLAPGYLEQYAQAVADKGSPLRNCFGFVDGTVRAIARPDKNQRMVYNGHKRLHALKFQSVALPNGNIANLYGPVEGRRHDAALLRESNLLADLERIAYKPSGEPLCLYGDPAYPLRPQLMGSYRQGDVSVLTEEMKEFNKAMSSVRISVEWLFGDVANYFKFIDYKKDLKIGMSSVRKQYIVSALFRNILSCLYGNLTSKYFQLEPPTLQEYLQ